jgi:hypothetical protein
MCDLLVSRSYEDLAGLQLGCNSKETGCVWDSVDGA